MRRYWAGEKDSWTVAGLEKWRSSKKVNWFYKTAKTKRAEWETWKVNSSGDAEDIWTVDYRKEWYGKKENIGR